MAETCNNSSPTTPQVEPKDKAALNPERCHFFLKKKRRYCRTIPPSDKKYCVEHSHLLGDSTRKRIPCPLDPKHTCYEDQLQKHLKKCNAREGVEQEFFVKNVNLMDDEGDLEEDLSNKVTVRSVETEEILAMIEKVKKLFEVHIGILECKILHHDALQEEINKPSNGSAAQKHLQQQASLVGHIEQAGLLQDGLAYIEFGAGKGGLSHWVQRAMNDSKDTQFILVEKGGIRYKMDNYHKGESQGPVFERLRVDIQHLHLGYVQSLCEKKRPIVGIGKHLCGGATDLMLRCLMKTTKVDREATENGAKTRKMDCTGPVKGIVLATCCHHRCTWQPYVGKSFMEACGIQPREFYLLVSMTSWATCATPKQTQTKVDATAKEKVDKDGSGTEQQEDDHETTEDDPEEYQHPRYGNLTPDEREEIGYMCKRLIDYGRQKYLTNSNHTAKLLHYIDKKYSLEDCALIAQADT